MDGYEATRTVLSRIQSLDPEYASKIMGLLLMQGQSEKDMIRLAFGPEALLHSVVLKARKDLGLCSPTSTTTNTPCASSWAPSSNLSDFHNLDDLPTPNCALSIVPPNGFNNPNNSQLIIDDFHLQQDHFPFLNDPSPRNSDLYYPIPDHPSAAAASTPTSVTDPVLFPSYGPPTSSWGQNHRRSFSFTDVCLGSSDGSGSGLGWKPCLYYARGYCKNGASCKFLHGLPDSPESGSIVGSPAKLDVMEQCQELLLRSKTQQQQQQQRLNPASQIFSPAAASIPYTTASSKCINFLLQQHQYEAQQRASAAASLMLGEDMQKFGRSRIEKNELLSNGAMLLNAGSRQIYLTFPADSTFREEDVSNYFSIYGPVQDVRIPFQQKRMFGFVTFVYPETVKLILAKGNPHFVCDARVLVKPYKEKGKVPDKYRKQQQQQVERGELPSPCGTPSGLDSRDPYDLQHGMQSSPRLLYNTQDLLWRRKLEEQAELQQAMELQSRRLMSLQLLDISSKDNHIQHRRNLSIGTAPPIFSLTHSHHHPFINQHDQSCPKSPEESCLSPAMAKTAAAVVSDQNLKVHSELSGDINGKEETSNHDDCNAQDSLEHNLPDSPFASPTKCSGAASSFFSPAASIEEATNTINGAVVTYASSSPSSFSPDDNNLIAASSLLPATSTLEMASYNSCLFQMPRFFSGHGAIQM